MPPTDPTNPTAVATTNPNLKTGLTQSQIQQAMEANRASMATIPASVTATQTQFSPATDSTISALRDQHQQKLQALFNHDMVQAQTYNTPASGNPGEPGYQAPTAHPLDPTSSLLSMGTQSRSTLQEMTDLMTRIAKRKDELTTGLDNALRLIAAKRDALSSDTDILGKESSMNENKATRMLQVLAETGGDITPEMADQLGDPSLAGKHIPGAIEKTMASFNNTQQGRDQLYTQNIIDDVKKGTQLKDIINKYKGKLTDDALIGAYDIGATQKGWGPHKEGINQLSQMGLNSLSKNVTDKQMAFDSGVNSLQRLDELGERYKKMNWGQRVNPWDEDAAFVNAQKLFISEALQKAQLTGRITQQEVNWALQNMPSPLDPNAAVDSKIKAIKQLIGDRLGLDTDQPSNGGSKSNGSGTKYQIIQVSP